MTDIKTILSDISIKPPVQNRLGYGGLKCIRWGEDNNFSQYLIDLVSNSPLQSSISESLYIKLCGASINVPVNAKKPNLTENWESLIRKVFKDYSIFEAFAFQLVLNQDNKTFSIYHQPISEVRFVCPSENDISEALICTDWLKSYRYSNVKKIKMYGCEPPKAGEKYLLYVKPYSPQEYYYHTPSYFSAANYIEADSRISKYYNNYIANNFNSQTIITFPSEENESDQKAIYEKMKKNFMGEKSAGSTIVLFGEGDLKPEIQKIPSPDSNLYDSLTDIISKYIITANKLTSPVLAGISTSSGFSSKSEEIIAAEITYRLNIINPIRSFILQSINGLLEMNGCIEKIKVSDYNLTAEYEGDVDYNNKIEDI